MDRLAGLTNHLNISQQAGEQLVQVINHSL